MKLTVTNTQHIAFDDLRVNVEGAGISGELRISDASQFDKFEKGDELELTASEKETPAVVLNSDVEKKNGGTDLESEINPLASVEASELSVMP